jgi:hypothetical protein
MKVVLDYVYVFILLLKHNRDVSPEKKMQSKGPVIGMVEIKMTSSICISAHMAHTALQSSVTCRLSALAVCISHGKHCTYIFL